MKYILLYSIFLLFPFRVFAMDTYECDYTNFSNKEGNHKEKLHLTFLIDKDNQKSYIVGNNGSNEVIYIDRGNGKNFIEVTGSGNIMSTAIDINMDSVHSRNSIGLDGTLLPSQYYGTCIKK